MQHFETAGFAPATPEPHAGEGNHLKRHLVGFSMASECRCRMPGLPGETTPVTAPPPLKGRDKNGDSPPTLHISNPLHPSVLDKEMAAPTCGADSPPAAAARLPLPRIEADMDARVKGAFGLRGVGVRDHAGFGGVEPVCGRWCGRRCASARLVRGRQRSLVGRSRAGPSGPSAASRAAVSLDRSAGRSYVVAGAGRPVRLLVDGWSR